MDDLCVRDITVYFDIDEGSTLGSINLCSAKVHLSKNRAFNGLVYSLTC